MLAAAAVVGKCQFPAAVELASLGKNNVLARPVFFLFWAASGTSYSCDKETQRIRRTVVFVFLMFFCFF